MTTIASITKTGAGHWRIVVEHENYSPKTCRMTSITQWTHTTTDSVAIDDYRSDDSSRQRRGERALIWQAKTWGDKEIIRYY